MFRPSGLNERRSGGAEERTKSHAAFICCFFRSSALPLVVTLAALCAPAAQAAVPAAPTGVTVAGDFSQATINWNAVTGATSYNIYYATFSNVTSANGSESSGFASVGPWGIGGLTNGVMYYFIVTAVNSSGESAASSPPVQVLVGGVPYSPSPVFVRPGSGQVTVVWQAIPAVSSYNLYYSINSNVSPTNGAKLSSSGTSLTVPSLTNNTPYYFVMTSVNSYGEGPPSAPAISAIPGQAPPAPTGVTAAPGSTQGTITMSWGAVTGATAYNVYYSGTSGVSGPNNGAWLQSTTNSLNFYGMAGMTNYMVVTAVTAAGESQPSAQVSAIPAGTTPPPAPTGVTALAGVGQVTLGWSAISGVSYYNVYYSTFSPVTTTNGTPIWNISSTSTVINLASGKTYYFIVTAMNGNGEGPASSQVSATPTAPTSPPLAPTGMKATGYFGGVTLNWNPSVTATSYNVYFATFSGITKTNASLVTGLPSSPWPLGGFPNGATYYFIMTAVNQIGESAASSPPAMAIVGGVPDSPLYFARPGTGQATLVWTPVPTAMSYNIYYSNNSNVSPGNGTKVPTSGTSFTITGLTNNTAYYFVMTTVNSYGEGNPWVPVSAIPGQTPPVPGGVNAAPGPDQDTITMSWGAVTGATAYNVYYSSNSPVTGPNNGNWFPTTATSLQFYSQFPGVTNYLVVTAVTNAGESQPSAQVSAMPFIPPPPPAPTGVTAVPGALGGQVLVSWNPVSGADWYNGYYSTFSTLTPANAPFANSVFVTSQTFSNLTFGVTYYFIVTAVSGLAGPGPASTVVSSLPRVAAPMPPTIATAAPHDSHVSLDFGWDLANTTSFNVYYKTSSGVTKTNSTKVSFSPLTPVVISGLVDGTTYYFAMTALNSFGESALSNEDSAMPYAMGPLPGSIIQSAPAGAYNNFYANTNNSRSAARGSDGTIHVAYTRGTPANVYHAYSTNGQNWTEEPVTSQTGANDQFDTAIAVDAANNIHVVWAGLGWGTNPSNFNVQYRQKTAAGSWLAQEAVSNLAAVQYDPAIAVDSLKNLHVIWDGFGWGANTGVDNIEYRERLSTGAWQPVFQVADASVNIGPSAALAIDSSDTVHVAWDGVNSAGTAGMQYRQHTSAGWQVPETVISAGTNDWMDYPSMAIDSAGNVHLAWDGTLNQLGGDGVFYAKRTTSWQPVQGVNDGTDTTQWDTSIGLDASDNAYVVWDAELPGVNTNYHNLVYRQRTSAGAWQTQTAITNSNDDQYYSSLIWAWNPQAGGLKFSRPKTGFALVWPANDVLTSEMRYYASPTLTWDAGAVSPCDVNKDSATNVLDVQLEVNMALGVTACTADINKDSLCNVIDVQRVTNAALGGQCVSP